VAKLLASPAARQAAAKAGLTTAARPLPPLSQPEQAPPSRKQQRREQKNALCLALRQRWPELFKGPAPEPLAIDIHDQIVAALDCDRKILHAVLGSWTEYRPYLKALARGEMRRNLDGSAAGEPASTIRRERDGGSSTRAKRPHLGRHSPHDNAGRTA
jgi:hypothetical protein